MGSRCNRFLSILVISEGLDRDTIYLVSPFILTSKTNSEQPRHRLPAPSPLPQDNSTKVKAAVRQATMSHNF